MLRIGIVGATSAFPAKELPPGVMENTTIQHRMLFLKDLPVMYKDLFIKVAPDVFLLVIMNNFG